MGEASAQWAVNHCVSAASSIEGLYADSGVRYQHHLDFYEYVALRVALGVGNLWHCDMCCDGPGGSRSGLVANRARAVRSMVHVFGLTITV